MIRRTPRSDQDFADEIAAHIQIEADQLVEEGIDPDKALMAARRGFGNVTRSEERFYRGNRRMWLDDLARNLRYALRQMRLAPVSSAIIVLSLVLGIGLNTAIFSLADQTLIRALPVEAPERLAQLEWNGRFVTRGNGSVGFGSLIPFPLYRELRADNDLFVDLYARASSEVHVTVGDVAEPLVAELVTGSYFPTLGVRPALGRLLGDDDDRQPEAHPVVVISHELWQRRYAADQRAIGSTLRVNGRELTVVGVAPEGFYGTDWSLPAALFIPMMMKTVATPGWSGHEAPGERFAHVFGRLRPGIDHARATVALQPWFQGYLEADTQTDGWPQLTETQMGAYRASTLEVLPGGQGQSQMAGQITKPMLILLAATGLIFVLACLNVANLSFARALGSRRATALRSALGASRRRIIGEQLVESGLLATLGCLGGAAIAPAVSRVVISFFPRQGSTGLGLRPDLDLRVLGFAVAITGLTTVLCGVAPALFAASVKPVDALKQQSGSVLGGLGVRKVLVIGQFVLALVLLVGAGLFARTLGTLRSEGPGYATTNLMLLRLAPRNDGYDQDATKPLMSRVHEALDDLPEIEHVGLSAWTMLNGGGWNNPVTIEADERVVTDRSLPMNAISSDFFETIGAPIVRGRNFDHRERWDEPGWRLRSVIVNEEVVDRYLGDMDPIGARLAFGTRPDADPQIEIVGVVKSFQDFGLREPEPQVYFSFWERPFRSGTFYVRGRSSSASLSVAVRDAVRAVDPGLTILALRTVEDQLDRLLVSERILATLATAFAIVATLLAMIGLYGVLSFSAELRTKEIGLRLALGAPRWSAGGLIVREAAKLALIGLSIALPLCWALGRLIEGQLYGVRPMDAPSLIGAVATLAAVCLVASAAPAYRAVSLDPLQVLRED